MVWRALDWHWLLVMGRGGGVRVVQQVAEHALVCLDDSDMAPPCSYLGPREHAKAVLPNEGTQTGRKGKFLEAEQRQGVCVRAWGRGLDCSLCGCIMRAR